MVSQNSCAKGGHRLPANPITRSCGLGTQQDEVVKDFITGTDALVEGFLCQLL
jgi:hypothetical protein